MNKKLEIDIDEIEKVSDILNITCDDTYFYILSNKKEGILGYYLLMIEIEDPEKEAIYIINWTNKTNIGQVDLNFMNDLNDNNEM